MPSVIEGFGLALAEALSTEKVVIASDIPPFKEIIQDKVNGLLFRSGEYKEIISKFKEVMNMDKCVLDNMRKNARSTILSNFDSNMMVKKYEDLYVNSII